MMDANESHGVLAQISTKDHEFLVPSKRINDGDDVTFWLQSKAYTDVMGFLLQLNLSMFPQKKTDGSLQSFDTGSTAVTFSETVIGLKRLLDRLGDLVKEAPPDTGPRRFGNVSFRKWYGIAESAVSELLVEVLPEKVTVPVSHSQDAEAVRPIDELKTYLLGSFGSAQRLDYGTGHELSFLAFIISIWKLGGFEPLNPGEQERGIVLGVIEP
jgi:serine/threonine-protein phosphatase 2A activator